MHRRCQNCVRIPENCTFSSAFTYKTEFFSLRRLREFQIRYPPGRLEENLAVLIVFGKLQHIPTSVLGQFSRQHQELLANGIDGSRRIILRQAQPFEPMHQIVGQQEQLQERHIGHPTLGGNFVERKIIEQFTDGLLHVGPLLIGLPNHPGLQLQVGHKSRIGVPAYFEQGQLLSFLRIFGQSSAHHDEPVLGFPAPRFKPELRYGPTKTHFLEARSLRQRQVGLGLAADNDIAVALFIQVTDELARKETRIGQAIRCSTSAVPISPPPSPPTARRATAKPSTSASWTAPKNCWTMAPSPRSE